MAAKCGSIFVRLPLKQEEQQTDLPDWHHKVTSLVGVRIAESNRKAQEPKAPEFGDVIEAETTKLIKRKLEVIEKNMWPCLYCDKVGNL